VNKWHCNFDNKLWTRHCLGFIVEIIKAILKKKLFARFIHFLYEKKGWLGWRRSVISCSSTNVQCSSVPINNRVFVIKSFKMTNFTNVELTNMIPAGYGAGVATRSNHK
jgi:hypothetical protein